MQDNDYKLSSEFPCVSGTSSILIENSVVRCEVTTPTQKKRCVHLVSTPHASHQGAHVQQAISQGLAGALIAASFRIATPLPYGKRNLTLNSNDLADAQASFLNDNSEIAKKLRTSLGGSDDQAVQKALVHWDDLRSAEAGA